MAAPSGVMAQAVTQADDVVLTYGEARVMAEQAWLTGNVPLANRLSKMMAEAEPDDVAALLMLSATETALGRPQEGRSAARRAFANSDSAEARYQASYLVASSAMAEDRYGAAQFWLRRAYQAADTAEQRETIAEAFGVVRRESPWLLRLAFDVAPSSNVNGGSQSPFLVIDDSPFVGVLSGAARALSGVEASLTGTLSYEISDSVAHRTTLAFHGYRSFVTLSDDAKEIAPRAEGSDFEYGVAEVELRHRVAKPAGAWPDTYRIAMGQTWYGGEPLDQVARLTFGRTVELGRRTGLRLSIEGEQRNSDTGREDRTGTEVTARLFHRLDNGVVLRTGLSLTNVASKDANQEYEGYEVFAGFWTEEPMMGLQLSGRLAYNERIYDSYAVGFLDVPGGRDDTEWSARLNMHVHHVDVMGFVPVVSLSGRSSTSNISRFEGESFGLSLGFASAF
ncbi:MAG: surface lipoprotein assembly modifier [Pseudomonadota bacterium]